MGLLLGKINSFNEETILFEAGDSIECIAYVQKGSVIKKTETKAFSVGEGSFICFDDICSGYYSCDYVASAGTEIFTIPASSALDIVTFLNVNKDLHKDISYPICCLCKGLYEMYVKLYSAAEQLYSFLKSSYQAYVDICKKYELSPVKFSIPRDASFYALAGQTFGKNLTILASLSNDASKEKSLVASSGDKYFKLQMDVINRAYIAFEDMFFYLKNLSDPIINGSDKCLFALIAKLGDDIGMPAVIDILENMKNTLAGIDYRIKNEFNYNLEINYSRIDQLMGAGIDNTISGSNDESDGDEASTIELEDCDLTNILLQLYKYAGLDQDSFTNMNKYMLKFMKMSDKYSKESDARAFRKQLTEAYYELYEAVFLKYATSGTGNILVKLFLDYGLLDERLVTEEQIKTLISIPPLNKHKRCGIYRMSDWLLRVYNNKDIPSKTEFDQEYTDYIRERKKNEALSAAEERRLLEDNVSKVHYEIQNMLKYNSRLLNGNLLSFYPMLHEEAFEKTIESLVLTSESILEAIDMWKEYDYSVFYREMMYSNAEQGIDKELIQKEIYPIFVLFPVVGVNGVMWQDISGKRSNSSGRFFLPAFFNGTLSDTMLTMLGRFRWELCKTMQGVAWNNIQVPSLTSEFIDYIQFYRKNKELTADKKEAIKNQLAKCHNNMRDFFVYDYTVWLKYEASGAMRLNKFTRRILATYCPLAVKYRDKIGSQPIFEEAMKRFNVNRLKKVKEYQTRINYYQSKGKTVPDELIVTKDYYDL